LPASVGLGGDLAIAAASVASARAADAIYQRHARFSIAGGLLAAMTGTPLILEYNGSEAFFESSYDSTPFAAQLRLCEEAILAASHLIVVTSEVDRDDLLARGVEPERLVLNPNGVDAERFARGGGSAVRERLGVAPDAPLLGFVGSYGPWHGTPLLAEAFVELAVRNAGARLLLVGDGPEHARVRQILADGRVSDRVLVVGKVEPAEIPAHLDACDVLVSPHIPMPDMEFFGSPTKLFEYMASGRAIVASRLGQIGDVLEDERSALLVEPGNKAALVSALDRALADPDLRSRLGAEARRDAAERHSWRANVQRVLDAYAAWAASA
nr:glycosyltransferase family 4 protein [Actinomycetota bacterium]